MKNKLAYFFLGFTAFLLLGASKVPVSNTLTDFVSTLKQPYIALFGSQEDAPRVVKIVKFGYNFDLDIAAGEDLWSAGGLFVFPSGAETLSIVSSSGLDVAAGTGGRTITISCIGTDGTESDITYTLTGTTPVVTTETCKFVNRAKVVTAGTGLTNAGNITITQSTSGLTLAHVPATYGITQQALYQVPSDRRCFINRIYVSADKIAPVADTRVIFYIKIYDGNSEHILRHELLDTVTESSRIIPNVKGDALNGGDIITIQMLTDTDNSVTNGEIDFTCVLD